MKANCAVLAIIVLILSGCTPHTAGSSEAQPVSSQTVTEADSGISKETDADDSEISKDASAPDAEISEENAAEDSEGEASPSEAAETEENVPEGVNGMVHEEGTEEERTMQLFIGEKEVPVTWEDNASVDALKELCPLKIQMSMYGGFEQVGPIGQSIVRDDRQTNTGSGDIVLYSGNQIVVFYGSNSWAYTRLGHADLTEQEMKDLLGNGDVTILITFPA